LVFGTHALTTRVDTGLVDRFRSIPVANIFDNMSRVNAGGPTLRPMHGSVTARGRSMCGWPLGGW
jgi:hypothetical protein